MLGVENISLLEYVLGELDARKGRWPAISKAIQPDAWESHYSWMSKLAQPGVIDDPGVKKIQALADYFRAHPLERAA